MNQEEQAKKMQQIIARTWEDEEFKKRLIADPPNALKEAGVEVRIFGFGMTASCPSC